jgi:hypothetical protein
VKRTSKTFRKLQIISYKADDFATEIKVAITEGEVFSIFPDNSELFHCSIVPLKTRGGFVLYKIQFSMIKSSIRPRNQYCGNPVP